MQSNEKVLGHDLQVVVGPVVDSHGTYAAAKLVPLQQKFPQHMFVHVRTYARTFLPTRATHTLIA